MRLAIYARYSDESQNDRSIEDQVRVCREHAARLGADVVAVYEDRALTGTHLRSRPGAMRMLADAKAGKFDAMLAEMLDRFSRDQEDQAYIYKRTKFWNVQMLTIPDGQVTPMIIGMKGTMAAQFITDLADRVRRGQTGSALEGRVPGGLTFGYDIERGFDARGRPITGRRAINAEQAKMVLRIFREYVAGATPREIAAGLNRDGIASPRGGLWNASTINGNPKRRNGILHNEMYAGRLMHNRQTFVMDPDSGKRGARAVPQERWITTEVPTLRIVPQDLWDRAQALKAKMGTARPYQTRRPKRLLSGLVTCACCGSPYTSAGDALWACVGYRERGNCTNKRRVRIDRLEQKVLEGMQARLAKADAASTYMETYRQQRRRVVADAARDRATAEQRLAQVTRQIERIVDELAELGGSPALRDRLKKLEGEKAELQARRDEAVKAAEVIELHPAAIEDYRRTIGELQRMLESGGAEADEDDARDLARMRDVMRRLIHRVEIRPGEKRGEATARVIGRLEELFTLGARTEAERETVVKVVAGKRIVLRSTLANRLKTRMNCRWPREASSQLLQQVLRLALAEGSGRCTTSGPCAPASSPARSLRLKWGGAPATAAPSRAAIMPEQGIGHGARII